MEKKYISPEKINQFAETWCNLGGMIHPRNYLNKSMHPKNKDITYSFTMNGTVQFQMKYRGGAFRAWEILQ